MFLYSDYPAFIVLTLFFAGSRNIKIVSVVIDLGIYISTGNNLKWSDHISHIHRNASLCSYQILRSFSTKNIWILLKAFSTYVRPKVEFNTSVWNPYFKKNIVLLESVQRNFTRYAFIRCNIPFNSYNDCLCKLGIKSLEYRRLKFDLILMFKICLNLCDLQFSNYFEYRHNKYNLRHNDFTVQTIHNAKQDRFGHFFFNRIVSV